MAAGLVPAVEEADEDVGEGLEVGEWKCAMCRVVNANRRWCVVCGHALDPADEGLEPEDAYVVSEETQSSSEDEGPTEEQLEAAAQSEASSAAMELVRAGATLFKRGGLIKSWKPRWIAMSTDGDGAPMLSYGKGTGNGRVIGSLSVRAVVGAPIRVGGEEVEAMQKEFAKSTRRAAQDCEAFGVVSDKRTYWFAGSRDEAQLWLLALRAVLSSRLSRVRSARGLGGV